MTRESLLMLGASFMIAVGVRLALAPTFEPHKELQFDAKLQFEGLPETLTVIGGPETIKVLASGSAEQLNQLDTGSVTASVDLSVAQEGVGTYLVDIKAPVRPRVTFSSRAQRVRLEVDRVSSIEEPVEVEPSGLPPREFVYGGASVSPSQVSVVGAESVLSRVRKVRASVDLASVRPSVSLLIPVEVLDEANRPVPYARAEPSDVTVNPAVAAAPAVKHVLVSPRFSGQPAFGYVVASYDVRPTQVRLRGDSGTIARLATIETEPVALDGAKSDLNAVARLRLPEGVRTVGSSTVRVSVKVRAQPTQGSPGP